MIKLNVELKSGDSVKVSRDNGKAREAKVMGTARDNVILAYDGFTFDVVTLSEVHTGIVTIETV